MKKYELKGFIKQVISMEVEAENLQEAMDKCESNYDFEEFDDESLIIVNGNPLEDEGGSIYLCDLEVADRLNY